MLKKPKPNKFDELDRDALVRSCLEMEGELERLRPKPAKFKLGQVVANPTLKSPYNWQGQTMAFFRILSVEYRGVGWFYGYAAKQHGDFHVFPEDKIRELTKAELTGADVLPEGTPLPPLATSIHPGEVGQLASFNYVDEVPDI